MTRRITSWINGAAVGFDADPTLPLLEVVREQFGLLGARRGCDTGYCGACTVLVDGEAVRSCLYLVGRIADRQVTTIEGLARDGGLDRLQAAFVEHGALECGYCIPGIVLLMKAFLAEQPRPSVPEIRRVLASNLCRCTGYAKMIEAVASVTEGD